MTAGVVVQAKDASTCGDVIQHITCSSHAHDLLTACSLASRCHASSASTLCRSAHHQLTKHAWCGVWLSPAGPCEQWWGRTCRAGHASRCSANAADGPHVWCSSHGWAGRSVPADPPRHDGPAPYDGCVGCTAAGPAATAAARSAAGTAARTTAGSSSHGRARSSPWC